MISCVVPTLNSVSTLEATLLSLRSQREVEVEALVADSGSTDGTLDVCRRWEVQTLYVPPGNMYSAINAGLKRCRGEWLAYLNSDDLLYPDSFSRLVSTGDDVQADVVYGNCDYVDSAGRFLYSIHPAAPCRLLSLARAGIFGFVQTAAVFRRGAYDRLGGFDEQYRLAADADFYLRALRAGVRFARLGGPPWLAFVSRMSSRARRGLPPWLQVQDHRQHVAGRARAGDYLLAAGRVAP